MERNLLSAGYAIRDFSQKAALTNHVVVHTGQKPFICEVCKKGFTQKCNIIAHFTDHTGVKPFTNEHVIKNFLRNLI